MYILTNKSRKIYLSKQKNTVISSEDIKGDNQFAKLKSLLIKLETQMEIEIFKEAEETIKKIHEIDYKNEF